MCYTDGRYAVAVIVLSAEKERSEQMTTDERGKKLEERTTTTNIFNLIFDLGAKKDAIRILPNTLDEYRRWANARRELEFFQSQHIFDSGLNQTLDYERNKRFLYQM